MRWRLCSWIINVAFMAAMVWCATRQISTAWCWTVLTPLFGVMVYTTYRADEEHAASLRRRRRTRDQK